MVQWESVALGYVSYLAIVAVVRREFVRARPPTLAAAALSWLFWTVGAIGGLRLAPAAADVAAMLALVTGYWLSGQFFVQPMHRLEASLLRVDSALLDETGIRRWYARAPAAVRAGAELSYLLVYVVVPLGALALAAGGAGSARPRYWATVLLAAFVAYGALPWVQTRPPRSLGDPAGPPDVAPRAPLRRLNLSILERASIGVNTLPSGHTATAVAVGLAVVHVMPITGSFFLLLAAAITAATVLGRYHFVLDAILGVAVAIAAWLLVG
jgi:hypothetical protein